MHNMGKLLISDGGNGHREISRLWKSWVINLVCMVALAFILFWIAGAIGGRTGFVGGNPLRPVQTSGVADFIRVIAGILVILVPSFVLYATIMAKRAIEKQEIYVYERGIEGIASTSKSEDEGQAVFELSYDLVSSIDVIDDGKRISINTPARKYTLYVNNPSKIRETVNKAKQLQQAGGSQ